MTAVTKAKQVAGSPSDWVERVARIGYATKGVVYALIGGLALKAAIGAGGSVGGGENAVREIGSQPFGQVLLIVTAIGLFGYAAWRFIQASVDPEDSHAIKRVGYVVSGIMHAFLGVTAVQLVTGGSSGGGQKTWVAKLMSVDTVGPILVVTAGALVIAYALYQIYKGVKAKFKDELKTGEMNAKTDKSVTMLGRVGLIARGIVFALVGGYLIKAGTTANPGQAKTLGDSLNEIASQSYGMVLLILVSLGLLAYAALQLALARYRKIPA